jgi:hydrogenase maturation protein HypF
VKRLAVRVSGVVQGVGFRPFVHRAATARGLAGSVRNDGQGVVIDVQGADSDVEAFVAALRNEAPPAARVLGVDVEPVPLGALPGFCIAASETGAGATRPCLPADLAPCAECLRELADPADRRHGYPFVNCTQCGPRYSIVQGLPYDRERTTMRGFALCGACAAEYHDASDRRYHAEPIACPRCGPRLRLVAPSGAVRARDDAALAGAVRAIAEGAVVAIKGVGGYQLVCSATRESTVATLRARKHRPDKPFAVLFASVDQVREHGVVSANDERLLWSREAPIVLVPRREGGSRTPLAVGVARSTGWLGAMLPASPLHRLLVDGQGEPVVCTSGNRAEEPICHDDAEALARLADLADVFLTHDRPIARPVDDSVARASPAGGVEVLRRARGWAPIASKREAVEPTVVAVGAHLKSTVAVASGTEVVVSQHLGDLGSPEARALLERTVHDLTTLLGATPQVVACDLHPDYASTLYAEQLALDLGARLERVQHHHAHVAACLAEHGVQEPVLGLAWDGAGLGLDGDLWGGEALVVEGAMARRIAHLRPFRLPGGERAAREPRRSALGILSELGAEVGDGWSRDHFSREELPVLAKLVATATHAPRTTSVGRLFDAVAALAGLRDRSTFEGQAPMELEMAAEDVPVREAYAIPVRTGGQPWVVDWEPLVRSVLLDRARGEPLSRVSGRFHAGLAAAAVEVARLADVPRVVLSGGCFQNRRLATDVRASLERAGFDVLSPSAYPPNDGGISLGQAWVATQRWKDQRDRGA